MNLLEAFSPTRYLHKTAITVYVMAEYERQTRLHMGTSEASTPTRLCAALGTDDSVSLQSVPLPSRCSSCSGPKVWNELPSPARHCVQPCLLSKARSELPYSTRHCVQPCLLSKAWDELLCNPFFFQRQGINYCATLSSLSQRQGINYCATLSSLKGRE